MLEFADPRRGLAIDLRTIQRLRRKILYFAALLVVMALPFIQPIWPDGGRMDVTMRLIGLLLIGAAVVGRCWCTLYIGGRKSSEVVSVGPYSISRNPLYIFSAFGVAGIGLQMGSLIISALLPVALLAIFVPVIIREEKLLAARFGREFEEYRAKVPRFGPRLSGWTDLATVEVQPRNLFRTLREGLFFFLAAPLCEAVDLLQQSAHVTPLFHLI
jgi:protein-S-isoprenylcysteine O-methyltransferase Ste14